MGRRSIDWRLASGFSALLFLIVAVGLVGIFQIQSLSWRVDKLGRQYFPMQKAVLEMRIDNSLYAKAVRSYIFWHNAKYLEAARTGANRRQINAVLKAFYRQLNNYSAFVRDPEQKRWLERVERLEQGLVSNGRKIVDLVDRLERVKNTAEKKKISSYLNNLVMDFENRLYRIDNFIDNNLQKTNLEKVKKELIKAEIVRKRGVIFLYWSLALGLLIGTETARIVYRSRRREKEREREMVQWMIKVEEKERGNLSRQIHDQMGQDLSALMIYSDLIDKKLDPADKEAKNDIVQSKKILSSLIDKSHNIAELLRPPALEEVGLADTIAGLIFQYKRITSIEFSSNLPKEPLNLPGEYSLILYRVVQEGLTNIVKHSQAKKVKISLEKKTNAVYLTVADDGMGFNYKQSLLRRRKEDRLKLGLLGLKERVELLGGSMDVKTAPGRGTRLLVQLPVT